MTLAEHLRRARSPWAIAWHGGLWRVRELGRDRYLTTDKRHALSVYLGLVNRWRRKS